MVDNLHTLTDKYKELGDDLYQMTDTSEEWLRNTPNDIKLLAMLALIMDANISECFSLDQVFFEAIEHEYWLTGYSFERSEIPSLVKSLLDKGYLEIY